MARSVSLKKGVKGETSSLATLASVSAGANPVHKRVKTRRKSMTFHLWLMGNQHITTLRLGNEIKYSPSRRALCPPSMQVLALVLFASH